MISIIYSEEFLKHDTGLWHPERPARLTAIVEALQAVPWSQQLHWQEPTPLDKRDVLPSIQQVHTEEHIQQIRYLAQKGGGAVDGDTPVSQDSYRIALLAVSAWLDGVDWTWKTKAPAFILARPPGHHATADRAMGFCLFSNAAIAAFYALKQPQIRKVAILDWDVHHGNGTEAIVEDNPQIAYCSLHQFPCYPGTGKESDRGHYNNVLNLPMLPGSGFREYQKAFEQKVMPFLKRVEPDILIVSAGYDANEDDPLANICLHPQDFKIFSESILTLGCPILFGLEGGYDLKALAESVVATLEPFIVVS
jgi:acetoin utilization deacetylase AcuC-like enzyme